MISKIFGAVAALAVFAVPVAAEAHGSNRDRFTHEATGYDVRTRSNGREMCLEGRNPETGQTFSLHLSAAGRVTGTFEGREVDYRTDRVAARRGAFRD